MRLWTIHPQYLDPQGLVALWRESLLAQKVLMGGTKGYACHPQLNRFRESPDPQAAIATYLSGVFEEAKRRGYKFDGTKIGTERLSKKLDETVGQLLYEWRHLKSKLRGRSPRYFRTYQSLSFPAVHPLFRIVSGETREWERLKR